ncbi:hypothetical protein DHW03_16095 [Pedobacter yonginense]|uniref:Nuclear transport factor 2 family protein n=1 Tax=Pedobacter yonginense TaxID=651869 RepID=A0A317EJK0_9SPHI|nr:nuclear transport factor 2 family protein [Pedobacter yonginense]PWS26307.1 hypothetical protein DHW03_16095 [Pedobacter yonginense]
MNLPKLIENLVEAQNNHDAVAYSSLFSANATVFDEGKHHLGNAAIQKWIENSNQQYQTTLKPIAYKEDENGAVFTAEVAGTFPGSPAVLNFNLVIEHDLIQSLEITG